MRLRTDIWVKAYLRRCASAGAMALISRSGDPERGAVYITVHRPDRMAVVYGPAPAGFEDEGRRFAPLLGTDPIASVRADEFLTRQATFDEDIWVVELDDREGRHFLDDELAD